LSVLEDDTLGLPEIDQEVDVYDAEAKEVLIMIDGIGVKEQKSARTSLKNASFDTESDTESAGNFVPSDVVLLEKKAGDFEYITSAIDKGGIATSKRHC
jgi:hypothetical protein